MNEIQNINYQLPDLIQDLAKFVLVIPDKISSVKSEIHAMTKLDLAKEVVEQKKEELQMLTEAYVDATVRMGDLTKQIERRAGRPPENYSQQCEELKPKSKVIRDLGFNKDQVSRFEKMANNKELVEQAKTECRESGETLTQSKVLNLIDEKRKRGKAPTVEEMYHEDVVKPTQEAYRKGCQEIDRRFEASQIIDNALSQLEKMPTDDFHVSSYIEYCTYTDMQKSGRMIDMLIAKLERIKAKIKEGNNAVT